MDKLADIARFKTVQNIVLEGFDPISAGGFTQIPNALLDNSELSMQAKLVYAKLLSYAWHNNLVFPGQERMATELGTSKSTINRGIMELQQQAWIEIRRRGQGRTNLYVLKYQVKAKRRS